MDREIITTIDNDGHFDIPSEIRERHGMSNGSRVKIEDVPNGVIIKSATTTPKRDRDRMKQAIEQSVGILGNDRAMFKAFLEDRKKEREREDRDLRS
jgi:AbrB family looped-hinge helix DNA binding protein